MQISFFLKGLDLGLIEAGLRLRGLSIEGEALQRRARRLGGGGHTARRDGDAVLAYEVEVTNGRDVRDAVIIDAVRSPIGKGKPTGALAGVVMLRGHGGHETVETGLAGELGDIDREGEAGLAFDVYDATRHRDLVELMFSDDRGWLKSTYPRDDPFRSFGYLLTTVWRVTRPRRRLRRRHQRRDAPPRRC